MASIERTTYPRFKGLLSEQELEDIYRPTEQERRFVRKKAQTAHGRLALMILLKCHQRLGYLPALSKVPTQITDYLRNKIKVPPETPIRIGSPQIRQRYREAILAYLDIRPYGKGGRKTAEDVVRKSAYTMSDPADLINAAIEQLIFDRYELPAYSTLDRLTGRIRQQVHEDLYSRVSTTLSPEDVSRLDALLKLRDSEKRTDFIRLKEWSGRPTLKHIRRWVERLAWLDSLVDTDTGILLANVSHTKRRQFAAEARALETVDMRAIHGANKRHTLLICLVHQARTQTRDELATMFLKRIRRIHKAAEKRLVLLRDENRDIEERMMSSFAKIVDCAAESTSDDCLGRQVRGVLDDIGGVEEIQEQYRRISACHSNNYLPLLWDSYRTHRTAVLRLLRLLRVKSATQDPSLLKAFQVVQQNRNRRSDYLQDDISLGFASHRWRALVTERGDDGIRIKRRQLEVCIVSYIADGLRCGDLFIPGSEAYTDYREQLLSWQDCKRRLKKYCQALDLPANATAFIKQLKDKLTRMGKNVDGGYPENEDLSIDNHGRAHLSRTQALPIPEGVEELMERIRRQMPERHLLDVLKHVHQWTGFTSRFGPLSGSDPKVKDRLRRHLFTVFGYGCNLGAAQTARHSVGDIAMRVLDRINKQHVTTAKLEAAIRDIVAEYKRLELPWFWGSGQAAIADGTHIELRENNLLGEQHIRYGAYGGIAYHHISDTYIALFSHFISCGTWEAVYILDGLLKNTSVIQPNTVHADTQGQSEPVFGLALLLGIKLMPRIRRWNKVTFYRPTRRTKYEHIGALFSGTVDWKLIKSHWKNMMQVALSIQAGKVLPSMLLQRLGSYNRHNKLYQAFRELGRVARTLFLLEYVSDRPLRQRIQGATTKIESFNAFCDWVAFGGDVIASGDPVEQEKRVKYTTLVANAVMLHNVVDLTEVLVNISEDGFSLTKEMLARLSPYLTEHIKRFGHYVLDVDTEPLLLNPSKIQLVDQAAA